MRHHPFTKLASFFLVCLLTFSSATFADDAELVTMVRELQKQMSRMQDTIDGQNGKILELEAKTSRAQVQMAPSAASGENVPVPMSDYEFNERLNNATGGANKWLKDLSAKGDIRLRYEAFQQTSGHASERDDRNRFRYRLRYGLEKKFNDDMKAGFSLASGEAGTIDGTTAGTSAAINNDPTSTNTSFDNNFNFKPIYIEKVYGTYTPKWGKIGPVTKTEITAGKFNNPFELGSSDIIWDRDVKPEGIYEKFDLSLLDTADLDLKGYFTAGQFVLNESTTATPLANDANLFALQGGLNAILYTPLFERPVDLLSAMSYYDYSGYAGNNNFTIGGKSLARGNSNSVGSATELDAGDFNIFEIYNELSFYPAGFPVRPFVDYAYNTGALNPTGMIGTDEDQAWALGLKLGGVNKKGDWELGYAHKYVGANSVPGFNDSDFGYDGHSGKKGNVFKATYGLTDNISVNTAAFFVENLNPNALGGVTTLDEQQRRFQLDMTWKF